MRRWLTPDRGPTGRGLVVTHRGATVRVLTGSPPAQTSASTGTADTGCRVGGEAGPASSYGQGTPRAGRRYPPAAGSLPLPLSGSGWSQFRGFDHATRRRGAGEEHEPGARARRRSPSGRHCLTTRRWCWVSSTRRGRARTRPHQSPTPRGGYQVVQFGGWDLGQGDGGAEAVTFIRSIGRAARVWLSPATSTCISSRGPKPRGQRARTDGGGTYGQVAGHRAAAPEARATCMKAVADAHACRVRADTLGPTRTQPHRKHQRRDLSGSAATQDAEESDG
jgi:hypothetical protein